MQNDAREEVKLVSDQFLWLEVWAKPGEIDGKDSPSIRKGAAHLLSGSVVGRGINFSLNTLLGRVLGPDSLGLLFSTQHCTNI